MDEQQKQEFGALYDRYVKDIYRFVYYKTHNTHTAEDLVTDIFLKALEKFNSFRPDKGNFRTWLYTIARRTVIDHYRTQKFDVPVEDAWDIASPSFAEKIHTQIDFEEIQKYMKLLSSEQREIIMLRLWEDLSFREIAEILGKSEAACKMSFSRALKDLKTKIPLSLFFLLLMKLI